MNGKQADQGLYSLTMEPLVLQIKEVKENRSKKYTDPECNNIALRCVCLSKLFFKLLSASMILPECHNCPSHNVHQIFLLLAYYQSTVR